MTDLMKRILPTVQKPARYTGGEFNEIKKDLKDVLLDAVEKSDLSEKQKLFCVYFVSCHNATQAYLMAYKCKKTSAETQGWVTLQNPAIKKEIARLKKLMRQEL